MNYIAELVEDDLKYICSVIPYKETLDYFKRYPREFSKLRPGFRVKSLNESDVAQTLVVFKNRDFISSYITKRIDRWLEEIQCALDEVKQTGLNEEETYIHVLARSFFAHNIPLYFKVIEVEKTDEYLIMMTAAVNQLLEIINESEGINKKHTKEIAEKETTIQKLIDENNDSERSIGKLSSQISRYKINEESMTGVISQKDEEISKLNEKLDSLKKEVIKLNGKVAEATNINSSSHTALLEQNELLIKKTEEFEALFSSYQKKELQLKEADVTINNLEMKIASLKDTVHTLTESKEAYEIRIEELEKKEYECSSQNNVTYANIVGIASQIERTVMPLRPVDMDDFDEYFIYNLNNIGFDYRNEAYLLFIHYIEKIAFCGVPLLIKRGPGINLANCLANTLYGRKMAALISYSGSTGIESIKEFLSNTPDRVVCIAGFIGNCNETELLPLLEQYRDKIIILTYMYDRTLNYIPMEILTYVQYINVDEYGVLLRIKDITEDPSEIKEESYALENETSEDNRYQRIFREIAEQCGFSKDVINSLATSIDSEEHMNCVLMFSVLPYVSKVNQMNPFNLSKRLQKYVGDSGLCPNKEIMLEWFG